MIESRKKVTAPKTYNPGKGRPKEHLAYLNREEMAALRRMNGNNQEVGPSGLPSFPPADAAGSSSKASSSPKSPSSATASVSRTTQNQAKSTPSTASRSVPSGGGARDSGQAANRPSTPMSSQGSSFSTQRAATNFNNRVTGQSLAGNNPSGSLRSFDSPKQGGVAGIAGSGTQTAFGGFDTGGIGTLPGPRADNPLYSNAPTVNLGAYVKDQDRVSPYQDLGVAGVPGGMPQRFVVGAPVNPYAGRVFDPSVGGNSPLSDPGVFTYDQNNPILSSNPIRPPSIGPNERYGGRVMTENERVAQALYGDATLGDVPMPAGRAFTTGVPVFPGDPTSTPAAPLVGISNLANPQNVNAARVAFANPDARYTAFNDVTPINPYSDPRYNTAPSYYADISSYRPSAPVRPAGGIAGVAGVGGRVNGVVDASPSTIDPSVVGSPYPGFTGDNPIQNPYAYTDTDPAVSYVNPDMPQSVKDALRARGFNPDGTRIVPMAGSLQPAPYTNLLDKTGLEQPAANQIVSNNTVADIMARYEEPSLGKTRGLTAVSQPVVSISNLANPQNVYAPGIAFANPDARYTAFNNVEPINPNAGQISERPTPRPVAGQAYGPFIDQYSLNDADTLAQQVAEAGFPGEPTPYAAATAQAEAIRRLMAEQPIVADNTPRLEVQVPGNERLDIDGVDPYAPPTDQYVPPVVPGQETPPANFTTDRRLAYLQSLGGGGRDSGTYSYPYTQPVLPPEEVVPPPVTPPPAAIDWFNMNRINSPYQTMVPTPLLQTAPVSTGVGSLLPRIVVVNPFA